MTGVTANNLLHWLSSRRLPRGRCGIIAVDTHVADADPNSTPLPPVSCIMYLCIMMSVSCISPAV